MFINNVYDDTVNTVFATFQTQLMRDVNGKYMDDVNIYVRNGLNNGANLVNENIVLGIMIVNPLSLG